MFTDLDVCECVAAHQDCFLGLDWEKDPSSACCNEIVVKVQLCWCFFVVVGNFVSTSTVVPWLQVELPGDTMKDLDLDVQKTKLTVQSKKQ